ncbi:unnamed protein product [Adineta steineri]|nr:unnamed protein product [Adineta steineri]
MFPSTVCRQGTILISGGFGGLGLTMSRWMIEKRDVKRIILMSRRTLAEFEQSSNPQNNDWLRLKQTINEYHAHVDVVQADVTNFDQVYDLIKKLSHTSYPVRGIIHSAAVAEDRTLAKIIQEYLTHVLAAKVRGAWILHQVTQLTHAPLHFFLIFSSIRNHLLEVASSGYNAGNQFLDALAYYRMTQQNLPAFSVSLPAVSGAGMFHQQRYMLSTLQSTHGFEVLPPIAVFELIERFHTNQKTCPCPVIFAANWQTLYERRHKLPIFQLYKIVEARYTIMKVTNISIASTELNSTTSATDIDRILVDHSLVDQEQSLASTHNLNKLFIDKIYEQQNQTRSAVIYATKIPSVKSTVLTSTYASDMILQMRRIQPRGPY